MNQIDSDDLYLCLSCNFTFQIQGIRLNKHLNEFSLTIEGTYN